MPPKAKPAKSPEPKKELPKKQDPKVKEQSPKKQQAPPPPPPPPPTPPPEPQQLDDQIDEGMDEASRRKKQADMFKKYLQQTGIAMAFQVVFAQILDKKVEEAKVFQYAAHRLRQIGDDLQKIKMSKK